MLKALGTGWRKGITWHDVEVCNQASGRPVIVLRGGAKEAARQLGIRRVHISISHCRSHAVAFAVAVGSIKRRETERRGRVGSPGEPLAA